MKNEIDTLMNESDALVKEADELLNSAPRRGDGGSVEVMKK
jgi:hypothetical protein